MRLIKPLVVYKENSKNFDKIEKNVHASYFRQKKAKLFQNGYIIGQSRQRKVYIFLNKHPRGTWSHV